MFLVLLSLLKIKSNYWLLGKNLREILRILRAADGEAAMKKFALFGWH